MNTILSSKKTWVSLFLVFIVMSVQSQITVPFITPGTTTWTVPACVTSITVQVWGGGGGGGGSIAVKRNSSDPEACSGAGGGGGGGFTTLTFAVIPGQTYTVVVGTAGNGGAGGAGSWGSGITTPPSQGGTGGTSSFVGNGITMIANGGIGGAGSGAYNNACACDVNAVGVGGAGGNSSGGTLNYTGGNGSAGYILNFGVDRSGAGGGAAGPGGNGGNAPLGSTLGVVDNFAGGTGNSPGGNGGAGRMYNATNNSSKTGGNGNVIGAGGGGGLNHIGGYGAITAIGGAGARGEVRIIYTVSSPVTPTFNAIAPICSGDALAPLPVTSLNSITGTWSPALSNTATTLYTFTPPVTACANSVTRTIVVDQIPAANVSANATVCAGGNITINGAATTGTSTLEYQFGGTGGAWTSLGTDIFNWTNAAPVNATVYLRAIVENGVCADVATTPISILVDPCGLPIELVSFSGECTGRDKVFSWITASELNNLFFTVEQSKDGQNYSPAINVPGAGTTTETQYYSATLANTSDEFSYFRLKQTDNDGAFDYSDVLYVGCDEVITTDEIWLFPNPASSQITLNVGGSIEGDYQLTIFDIVGKEIRNDLVQLSKNTSLVIDVNHLSRGNYFLKLKSANGEKDQHAIRFSIAK